MTDQFSPPRGPRVGIHRDFMLGVALTLALDYGGDTIRILHFGPDNSQEWKDYNRFTSLDEPTMYLPEELARELYNMLAHFYQGEPDTTTARADLLHERGRVDKLTDALIEANKELIKPPVVTTNVRVKDGV
jgi:hypothetical protein